MKKYRILLWGAGTVLLFTFFTAFSYRGGMPYTDDTTMGFPLIFLRKSVGQNVETGLFAEIKDFHFGYLFVDIVFSVLLVLGLFKLFRFKYTVPDEEDS